MGENAAMSRCGFSCGRSKRRRDADLRQLRRAGYGRASPNHVLHCINPAAYGGVGSKEPVHNPRRPRGKVKMSSAFAQGAGGLQRPGASDIRPRPRRSVACECPSTGGGKRAATDMPEEHVGEDRIRPLEALRRHGAGERVRRHDGAFNAMPPPASGCSCRHRMTRFPANHGALGESEASAILSPQEEKSGALRAAARTRPSSHCSQRGIAISMRDSGDGPMISISSFSATISKRESLPDRVVGVWS